MVNEIVAIGYPFFTLLAFFWGACIGSFLNVCIYRIPRRLSVVAPRSHCPGCKNLIAWYDNIPLLSWVVLRARCRHCGTVISARYVIVELLTAILFLLAWFKFGATGGGRILGLADVTVVGLVPVYWLILSGLLLGGFVDCRHMIIPDRVTIGGMLAGLVLSPLVPALHGQATALLGLRDAAIGAAFGFGLLWLIAKVGKMIFRKEAMGFGDVKLMGALGAFFGVKAVCFILFFASLLGALFGVFFILTGRRKLGRHIPFGPYIVFAALIWMLWGPRLMDAYMAFLAPPLM
jgi:leader peptidase (prepilin peptidase)/N-methyltransferase